MALPPRVRLQLEHEQYRSELWVAGVQLALLALLAAAYASVPPGYAPSAPVRVEPLGLALFGVLVGLRLYFAVTRQLRAWMLGASVVAEAAIVLFVVWASHLQYEQAPQFYLKSSGFQYLFMLIALRALRFEPLWVLLSGATAVAGWAALLAYAWLNAPRPPLTWDLVTALSSQQIHLGAEVDRLVALAIVTGVLALALARARRLLVRSVGQGQAIADLSQFFDAGVARRITASRDGLMAGHGELREAAVVFFDLRGFTQASRTLAPDALLALLGEYQGLVVPVVARHGGSIDKFMGDGILASFGAVQPDAACAAHALSVVDEVMQAAAHWQAGRRAAGLQAPGIGAGLACGTVVFGVIGVGRAGGPMAGDATTATGTDSTTHAGSPAATSAARLEYTVLGDPVNLAAKLEKHNKAEHTAALTTRATFELACAQGYTVPKPLRLARHVAGVAEPLDLAVLHSTVEADAPPVSPAPLFQPAAS